MKSGKGDGSIAAMIGQAIRKEPFTSFSRTGESLVQWIRSLHALDQQDLPNWPLLSSHKVHVEKEKCGECSQEFYSPVNRRRHIFVDHQLKKLGSSVDRDKLGAFWYELSLDKAKETVSFNNAAVEEFSGSSITTLLVSLIQKQGHSSLPQASLEAGSALLGIVRGEFHEQIPSDKLFHILDDASEKTFLHGRPESVQNYVFNGEARKIDLDRNVVASTSFLLEHKLVKAYLDRSRRN